MNRNHARAALHILSFAAIVLATRLEPSLATFALVALVVMQALLVFKFRRPRRPLDDSGPINPH